MAHLRLPILAKPELRDLIETFSRRKLDKAEAQRKRAEREKALEEELGKERELGPLTRVRTGTKSERVASERFPLSGRATDTISEPIYRPASPEEIENDLKEREERLRAIEQELESVRSETTGMPTSELPASRVTGSSKVLEGAEVDAISGALDEQTGTRTTLGPRAIRAFIFRYQLARLLLNTLRIEWDPKMLANSLASRSFRGTSTQTVRPVSANLTDAEKLQRVVDQVC